MSIADYAVFAENLIADADRLLADEPKEIKPLVMRQLRSI